MGQRPFFESGPSGDRWGFSGERDIRDRVLEDPGVDCDFRPRRYDRFDDIDNLASLVRYAVYEAIPRRFPGENPSVTILANGYNDEFSPYFGYVTESRSGDNIKRAREDLLRSRLIHGDFLEGERLNVKVVRLSCDDCPEGPYHLVATDEKVGLPGERPYDMTAETAHSIVEDYNIYCAQVKYKTDRGNLLVRVYPPGKNGSRNGYLNLTNDQRTNQRFAEWIISKELSGYDGGDPLLSPGDKVLVRKLHDTGKTLFFEPVVNFLDSDHAVSPVDGHEFRTRVKGREIYDLILFPSKKSDRGAVAYVPRPAGDGKSFFYKQVVLRGAGFRVGTIVRQAHIQNDLGKIYKAKVVVE
ncbi:MAG: hypothetical protein ABII01_02615 [Candidatus Woesearchaeota archaeon]